MMKRKVASIFGVLMLVVCIAGCGASAQDNKQTDSLVIASSGTENSVTNEVNINKDDVGKTFVEGEYEYTVLEDGTAMLSYYSGSSEKLELPESINGYKLSQLGKLCFKKNDTLKELIVPGTVKIIAAKSVSGASGLKTLILEEGVEVIERDALPDRTLTSMQLPSSLKDVGEYLPACFESRDILECYQGIYYVGTIACGVKYDEFDISNFSFKEGTTGISGWFCLEVKNEVKIDKLIIPDGVKFIGEEAFYEDSDELFASYEIPSSVEVIGDRAIGYGELNFSPIALTNETKIYGKANTMAEKYAEQNRFTFVTVE